MKGSTSSREQALRFEGSVRQAIQRCSAFSLFAIIGTSSDPFGRHNAAEVAAQASRMELGLMEFYGLETEASNAGLGLTKREVVDH
jgi:hypothetical protein